MHILQIWSQVQTLEKCRDAIVTTSRFNIFAARVAIKKNDKTNNTKLSQDQLTPSMPYPSYLY